MHQDLVYIAIALVAALLAAAQPVWSARRRAGYDASSAAADTARRVAAAHTSSAYARISVR
ncbi:MAG TPA: hypothetical protein VEZ46_10720 [Mycobacteriales bacterium]|jgi:hypothetical protein|nr:hypothetical protein [Mycobacteriales bacterium]